MLKSGADMMSLAASSQFANKDHYLNCLFFSGLRKGILIGIILLIILFIMIALSGQYP